MKKNILKIATLTYIATIATLNIGCSDDFLDRKPLGIATEGDVNIGGFEEKVFGLYSKLRTTSGVGDWTRYWFQSIRSDDAEKGSTPADASTMGIIMDGFNYIATNEQANSNWDGHYELIYECNNVISIIEKSGKTDTGTLINLSEVKALRAWAYFELRRDYGEVPIITKKIETPTDAIAAKNTVAEVDAFIKSELDYAIQYLPLDWFSQKGRATKGFANSLLAKLALYQNNWATALSKAEEVIGSGVYQLHSSYATLFTDAGDNSTEGIFEIQFTRLTSGTNYSSNYWESQGVRGSGDWDLGWGFNVPTENFINTYETSDLRKKSTILEAGGDDGYGNVLPAFGVLPNKYYNKKAYTDPADRNTYGEMKNHWTNIKVIRYADVLLMAAEAANELGQTSTATTYLNQVRTRAGLTATTATTQTDLRTAIKNERRFEFALEGERFYDLVRWGDATTVLGGLGYQTKNALFPIPQTAIDESGGVLIQNPNY